MAEKGQTTGTPRWVKVFGIVALVVVVVVVIMLVTGTRDHGPGRHAPSGVDAGAGKTGGHVGPPPGVTHP